MKTKLMQLILILFSINSFSVQSTEGFSNFAVGCNEVKTGSFTGDNNVTCTYKNCRGDKDRQAVYTTSYTGFKSVAQQFSQNGYTVSKKK